MVAGGVELDGCDYWSRAYNLACFHRELGHLPSGPRQALPTMNLACATATARRIGPFREDLARCYDYDWTLRLARAGGRLLFDPAARVGHHPCGVTPGLLWRTFSCRGALQPGGAPATRRCDRDLAVRSAAPDAAGGATPGCAADPAHPRQRAPRHPDVAGLARPPGHPAGLVARRQRRPPSGRCRRPAYPSPPPRWRMRGGLAEGVIGCPASGSPGDGGGCVPWPDRPSRPDPRPVPDTRAGTAAGSPGPR